MRSSYRLFRVFGISVELHATFLLLLFLLVLSPLFVFLLFTTAFFFVLLHELAHSLVAKSAGIPVERITLTPIGGIASVEVPQKPWIELGVSVAGPLFNLMVAGACLILLGYLGVDYTEYLGLMQEAAVEFSVHYFLVIVLQVNLVLGLFNLLPGFPMDGGRILRSLLAFRMDYVKATELAVSVGRYLVFPLLFIAGMLGGNIFLVFIAFFLYLAGGQEVKFTKIRGAFEGVTVGEVMAPKPTPVPAATTVLSFLGDPANLSLRYHVVAGEGGRVLGVLDIADLGGVDLRSRRDASVGELAGGDYGVVSAGDKVNSQLPMLFGRKFVLVVSESRVVGCLTPEILFSRMPVVALRKSG